MYFPFLSDNLLLECNVEFVTDSIEHYIKEFNCFGGIHCHSSLLYNVGCGIIW